MNDTNSRQRKGWIWPFAIAIVLLVSAGSNIVIMLVARSDKSFAIEPDYYQKALDWDDVMAQEERNISLGWHVDARVDLGSGPDSGRVVVTLTDSLGEPLQRASVDAVALHNARAAVRMGATLSEEGPGVYSASIAADKAGLWDVIITAQKGPDRFVQTVRVDASSPRQ